MAVIPKMSEIGKTQGAALVFIGIITLCLAGLNVTGAWVASENGWYTGVIFGVELLAAVCLVLILDAPTLARKIVGSLVFAALIYVCVENGKMAIKHSFDGIFTESPEALRAKAELANTDASDLKVDEPADRQAVKTEIAELQVFQKKMSAMSPEGIMAAQSEMIPRCGYTGRVDGIRNVLTEGAMRRCGEQITNRILVLQAMDTAPTTRSSTKSVEAVDFTAKAKEIDDRTIWMNILLFAVEGARSAGLWAFVIWGTGRRRVQVAPDIFADLQAQADELAKRKANINEGVEKRNKTNTRTANKKVSMKILEDQRAEAVKKEAAEQQAAAAKVQEIDDAIAAMRAEIVEEEEPQEPVEAEQPELELTEPEPVAEAAPEEPPALTPGTDLVVTETPAEPEDPTEESDDENRPLQAAE